MADFCGRWRRRVLLSIGLAGAAFAALPVRADCSRVLQVPVAPIGMSVIVGAEGVSGVYPDALRAVPGCSFVFTAVPRARLEALFESGRADVLMPASRTARRDDIGFFVPLVYSRATLISLNAERAALRSLQELRERRELRVALVRGFDYGAAYQDLLKDLRLQGRLALEVDAVSVARMLNAGLADLTIMAPSIFIGALHADARVKPMLERLRYEPVEELPWSDSGIYISKRAVSEADRDLLREALDRAARSGAIWRAFQRYYPPGSLTDSIRPR